jgi:pilus assembly protein CpaC
VDEFMPNGMSIPDAGVFASFLSSDFLFNMAIDAARENGLARVLAEPTITTLTGQEAKFLSGGEFPIPVPQDQTGITIEFKEFGVSLRMLPTVLSSGQINVKLDVSVSELQSGSNVSLSPTGSSSSFYIPALTKRSAAGTVELADGQTIGLAGLINENMRSVVTRFPGLGSLPVLGSLFRSQEWIRGETELVILVTPRLAKPVDPSQIRLPTDGYKPPSDWEFYGLGRQQAAK